MRGSGEDLRLGLGREVDDLGVAAVLDVEHTIVGPAVLVVTDELALGVGAERGLAGARQAEENGSVAIRWVKQEGFCKSLLKSYKKPLLSTSANVSGEAFSGKFKDIHQDILKQADYVVNLPQHPVKTKSSTIWEIHLDGSFSILRP